MCYPSEALITTKIHNNCSGIIKMIPSGPYQGHERYSIFNTSKARFNDTEGPGKCNNTEVNYVATVYTCHTTLDT
jgi:hypothetical protein